MALLLSLLTVLLLAGPMFCQDKPHEAKACTWECRCTNNFPVAVYCDNSGLKRIPSIPPHTLYLYVQNNLVDVLSEDAYGNTMQLLWLSLNSNKITSDGTEEGALRAVPCLVHLYKDDNLRSPVPYSLPARLEQLRLLRNCISKTLYVFSIET